MILSYTKMLQFFFHLVEYFCFPRIAKNFLEVGFYVENNYIQVIAQTKNTHLCLVTQSTNSSWTELTNIFLFCALLVLSFSYSLTKLRHNLRASKSKDRRVICSSETLIKGILLL